MTQFLEPQEMDQIANKQTLIHEYVENYVAQCNSQARIEQQVKYVENIDIFQKLVNFVIQVPGHFIVGYGPNKSTMYKNKPDVYKAANDIYRLSRTKNLLITSI